MSHVCCVCGRTDSVLIYEMGLLYCDDPLSCVYVLADRREREREATMERWRRTGSAHR